MISIVSAFAAVLGVVITFLAWQWPEPQPPAAGEKTGTTTPATTTGAAPPAGATSTGTTSSGTTSTGAGAAGPAVEYLNTMPAERNADNLTDLPRAIRAKTEYLAHPIVIACPSNEVGDEVNPVVWRLDRHYVEFHAEVRPFYPEANQQRAVTEVTAVRGIRQPDTTVVTGDAGKQLFAKPGGSAPLDADLEGADTLEIQSNARSPPDLSSSPTPAWSGPNSLSPRSCGHPAVSYG